jgi:pseudouridine-5'-phosphate glycosidase
MPLPSFVSLSREVAQALSADAPVVALESTVITHGLPYPENVQLAQNMERTVREHGATPATIAILDGKVFIGLNTTQLERLAQGKGTRKISVRDFAPAIVQKAIGGTTVAATLAAAHVAGLRVFATGGIGGVHRQVTAGTDHPTGTGGQKSPDHPTGRERQAGISYPSDISTDLTQLARTPLVVVCAGAKAILDLPATLEMLETLGVPVLGYQSDEFPAFYSRSSGLPVSARAETPMEIAKIAQTHWQMGFNSAVLVANPPPVEHALSPDAVDGAIQQALDEAQARGLRGQGVTPFLLMRVSELTSGDSLRANLALLLNNARLAAQIACVLPRPKQRTV